MLTFAKDKAEGFTEEYTKQFKHKCGTCFSNGPVDVGVTTTLNGVLAYTCEKCVEKRAAEKAQRVAQQVSRFAKRWVV